MRLSRSALIGLILLLAAVLPAPVAEAHAVYVGSSPPANEILPDAPASVAITFSESVTPGSAAIRVRNASDVRVDIGAPRLSEDRKTAMIDLAPGGPGAYDVEWTVQSAVDGHPTSGSFCFAVQNPDGSLPPVVCTEDPVSGGPPVSALEVGLRFLAFGGLALAFGATVLARFVWLPAGRDPDARDPEAFRITLRIVLHWARIGALLFALALVGLWIETTGLEVGAGGSGIVGSPFLLSLAARIALGGILFLVLAGAFVRAREAPPEALRRPLEIGFVLALAAIAAGSFGTHAAANATVAALGIAADAGHIAGVAYWVGGLASLVAARSFLRSEAALPLARYVFAGFSRFAAYAVALVIAGGTVLAVLLVGSVESLLGTGYGWVVLAKLSLFTPMLAVGAYNRFRLVPKTAEPERVGTAVRSLSRNVRLETTLGVVILAAAAVLTTMTPAISLAAGPQVFRIEAVTEDLRLRFQVFPYPTVPGDYTFTLLVYNATTNQPYNGARSDSGLLTFNLTGSPPTVANLSGPHGNHFFVTSGALSQPGTWRVDVRFERADRSEVRATFHVTVRGGS